MTESNNDKKLRTGFTTGACATACSKAALFSWLHQKSFSTVSINLPKGEQVPFTLHDVKFSEFEASASTIKDAGDDPDVTHGATITAHLAIKPNHQPIKKPIKEPINIIFVAGKGIGIVTKPGLPVPVGEPAINPVPRKMIRDHLEALAIEHDLQAEITITLSVKDGENLAEKTWNPRLGIIGGLSILGTTGIVRPYSCAAWIHAIHRGIDVARALGLTHIAGSTGNLSEQAVMQHYQLSPHALIDMGDFAAGMLKYLRKNPIQKVIISGGFGKMLKLASGHGDLHSARAQIDFQKIAGWAKDECGCSEILAQKMRDANSAAHLLILLQEEGDDMAQRFISLVAEKAKPQKIFQTIKSISILC